MGPLVRRGAVKGIVQSSEDIDAILLIMFASANGLPFPDLPSSKERKLCHCCISHQASGMKR
jgi:hypothetical protein